MRIIPYTAFPLLILAFLLPFAGIGQMGNGYAFPIDDSVRKRACYQESVEQNQLLLNGLGRENRKQYQEIYNDRLEELQSLFLSSRAVTIPAFNNYLQLIVNEITRSNTELANRKFRVLFTRDWWPNAFSTGEGTIAINGGLFLHLENESELAFIICHELAHEFLKHGDKAITDHITNINDGAIQRELKKLSRSKYRVNQRVEELAKSFVFNSRQHSRLHEREADSLAYVFLARTNFSVSGAVSSLQKLDDIDERATNKPLTLEQTFSFRGFPFRQTWIEKESGLFSAMNGVLTESEQREKDSLKTHPDCKNRIAFLKGLSIGQATARSKFVVNEEVFSRLQNDFSMEITEQCFQTDQLSRHLYFALRLLEEEGPKKQYAAFAIFRTLNKLYEKQKAHAIGHSIDKEDKRYSEEYNLLLRMLDRLTLDELLAINSGFSEKYAALLNAHHGYKKESEVLQTRIK